MGGLRCDGFCRIAVELSRGQRACANSMHASAIDRSLSARRGNRCRGSVGRGTAGTRAEKTRGDRKSGRSHRQYRHRRRYRLAAGRLHALGQRGRDRDFPGELQQAPLRSDQGSGSGRRHRDNADAADHRERKSAERPQGPGAWSKEQARWSDFQHRRLWPVAASCRGGNGPAAERESSCMWSTRAARRLRPI